MAVQAEVVYGPRQDIGRVIGMVQGFSAGCFLQDLLMGAMCMGREWRLGLVFARFIQVSESTMGR